MPVLGFVLKHINRPMDASTFNLTPAELVEATVNHESTVIGRTILDLLVINLWNINSLDALVTFFQELQTYYRRSPSAPPGFDVKRRFISHVSPLGVFLRRSLLEFEKLQFHEINSLWYAFVRYREPTFPLWKFRPHSGGMSIDINLRGTPLDDPVVRKVYLGRERGMDCRLPASGLDGVCVLTGVRYCVCGGDRKASGVPGRAHAEYVTIPPGPPARLLTS